MMELMTAEMTVASPSMLAWTVEDVRLIPARAAVPLIRVRMVSLFERSSVTPCRAATSMASASAEKQSKPSADVETDCPCASGNPFRAAVTMLTTEVISTSFAVTPAS